MCWGGISRKSIVGLLLPARHSSALSSIFFLSKLGVCSWILLCLLAFPDVPHLNTWVTTLEGLVLWSVHVFFCFLSSLVPANARQPHCFSKASISLCTGLVGGDFVKPWCSVTFLCACVPWDTLNPIEIHLFLGIDGSPHPVTLCSPLFPA